MFIFNTFCTRIAFAVGQYIEYVELLFLQNKRLLFGNMQNISYLCTLFMHNRKTNVKNTTNNSNDEKSTLPTNVGTVLVPDG